jgi:hypothetical protein
MSNPRPHSYQTLSVVFLLSFLLGIGEAAQTPVGKTPLDDLDSLLKGDAPSGTLFRLVDAADPKRPLAPQLFWRHIPAFTVAHTTPVRFHIGGEEIIGPKQVTEGPQTELSYTYPIEGRRKLDSGRFVITPGEIPLSRDGGRIKSDHPALRVVGDEVQILCAPVRFDSADERGVPVPVRVTLQSGKDLLLRESAAFNPLLIWLPVGVRYQSSLGSFTLSPQGRLENVVAEAGVSVNGQGLRLLVKSPAQALASPSPANQLWLVSHRNRTVFAPHEAPVFTVLVPRGFSGGEAKVLSKIGSAVVALGTVGLPAVMQGEFDSRAFTVRAANLPLGAHEMWVEAGGASSAHLPLTIVSWEPRSSFFTHTTSHCTGQWPATEAGLKLLSDAGVQMVAASSHKSYLDTVMPSFAQGVSGPPETGIKGSANDLLLENLLRHGLRSADLTPMRGQGLYLESLSYHHSYAPTVERMVRKLQLYTQQSADYPSAWGVNYSWFPQLGGYSEGGVPTDAHVGDRNRALAENLAKSGFRPMTKEEREFHKANKFSSEPAARSKALEIQNRAVEHWKAQQDFGWGVHNKKYNDAVREVRPDTQCLLLENAGHDSLKRTRSLFGDMAASFYGTYTDYGDWPLSAGFTVDWAHGNNPGRPVWITTSWGTSPEGSTKSLLHAFSRGAAGAGVPMQEESGMGVLARRSKGLAFVTQFGAIATRGQPDSRFAILSTASQQVFGGANGQYIYHALYGHLTRLGCAPVIVDDVVVAEKGVPAAVKVLFLVRQQQPLEAELAAALAAFQQRGGKVLMTGDCMVEIPGATRLSPPIKQLWELGGFTPASHANLWNEFQDVWQAPLATALKQTGVAPLAATEPDRALVNCLEAGPVRYAVVISSSKGSHSNVFEPNAAVPVSLEGTGWIVRDLVKQEYLKTTVKDGRTAVAVDLVTEPVTVLACYRTAPQSIEGQGGIARAGDTLLAKASVHGADNADFGPVPLRFELRDPAGGIHSTLYRAAGEEAKFHVGKHARTGEWQLTIQEQITGLTLTDKFVLPPADNPASGSAGLAAVADVHVVNEGHALAFAQRGAEKLVIVEAGQEALLPAARKLVERLIASGRPARIWQVNPEDFDTIPVRWYPQEEDVFKLQQVSDGKLVGYRGNMVPFIDKVKRAHVPERGGYAEDGPFFRLGSDCVVFSGGLLAESLRAVTPWIHTPNAPGRGQSRLVVCFSAFAAGRQVAAIIGNDIAGLEKAAEKLGDLATATAAVGQRNGTGSGEKGEGLMRLAGVLSPSVVATPLRDFTPLQRTRKLLANTKGHAAVFIDGKADTLAFVEPSGRVTATVAVEPGLVDQARMDERGRVWTLTARGTARDKAWNFENAHELILRAIAPDGTLESEALAYAGETHDLPPDYEAGVRIAPDGQTYAFGRRASVLLGRLDGQAASGYDDLLFVRNRFEVRNPRFPVGTTFSPDSSHVFFTMDTRPRFGGMGVASPSPVGCEATLVDARTGQRIWGLRASGANSSAFAALSGFAAVSEGGAFTALADYQGTIMLVDKSGRVVLRESIYEATNPKDSRRGPPNGVGVWISKDGSVAAWLFRDALYISNGAKLARVDSDRTIVGGGISADGTQIFASYEDGEITGFSASGQRMWSFSSGGPRTQIASVGANELLVAANSGELIRLDQAGKEMYRVNLAAAADQAKHPIQQSARFQLHSPPFEVRDPGTLALARAELGARQVAAWKPTGQARTAFGREFFTATSPVELSAGEAVGECFVHLVYRRPEANRKTTVTTTGSDGTEKFSLDLPTPQYRVVDIPVRGPGVKVAVDADGPLEVAECSLWSFRWPGGNKLYVAPVGGASGTQSAPPSTVTTSSELNLDDLLESGGTSGMAKDVKIYVFNPDPDQVKGPYLKAGADPMTALDGRRFGNGKMSDWVSGKPNYKGAWLTVDFGKPTPLRLVATYERVNRQSAVNTNFAVFSGFIPTNNETGELLKAAVGNDQFWRLLPVNAPKTTLLGIQVFGGRQQAEGLSEVEAY